MPRLAPPLTLLLLLGGPIRAADVDESGLRAALGRTLLVPGQTLAEAQSFVDARIPDVPAVRSADEWRATAARLRADTLRKVVFRGQAVAWRDATTRVEFMQTIDGGPGYHIRKLRFEALPGLWIPALLYEPDRLDGRVPVVLNVNGHDAKGKAVDYKQLRCINQAKRGMIALNLEWFGMGQLKTPGFGHGLINAIDLCGTSGIATHFLAMKRGIDILLSHEHADPRRVGVTGLSGGGWQTIFISPLDPRVTFTNPVAGYSSFHTRVKHASDLGDSEQTPCDLATVVDYAHLTAMMAPHPTLLTFNAKDDCCFASPHALAPLIEAAAPIFRLLDKPGNLREHINHDPGNHNYGLDNRQALYQMMADAWSEGGTHYDPKEIPSDGEVKSADQLKVDLPADNADLHRLAVELARDLPQAPQGDHRDALRAIVRPYDEKVQAERGARDETDGLIRTGWILRLGSTWSVPVVELSRGEPKGTVLVIADGGRASAVAEVKAQLDAGRRVLAVDPFSFGECEIKENGYLWALMVGTVGERPLGLQVGQVAAVARWAAERSGVAPTVVAVGPRTSTVALVAAAIEEKAIAGVVLHEPLGSLKELIESSREFSASPELFCFGLLASFDLKQVAGLVAPRPVELHRASDRAKAELAGK